MTVLDPRSIIHGTQSFWKGAIERHKILDPKCDPDRIKDLVLDLGQKHILSLDAQGKVEKYLIEKENKSPEKFQRFMQKVYDKRLSSNSDKKFKNEQELAALEKEEENIEKHKVQYVDLFLPSLLAIDFKELLGEIRAVFHNGISRKTESLSNFLCKPRSAIC